MVYTFEYSRASDYVTKHVPAARTKFSHMNARKSSSHLVGCPTYRAGPPPYEQGLRVNPGLVLIGLVI